MHPSAAHEQSERALAVTMIRSAVPLIFERTDLVLTSTADAISYVFDKEPVPSAEERETFISDAAALARPRKIRLDGDDLSSHALVNALLALSDLTSWIATRKAAAHKTRFYAAAVRAASIKRWTTIADELALAAVDAKAEAMLDSKSTPQLDRPELMLDADASNGKANRRLIEVLH